MSDPKIALKTVELAIRLEGIESRIRRASERVRDGHYSRARFSVFDISEDLEQLHRELAALEQLAASPAGSDGDGESS